MSGNYPEDFSCEEHNTEYDADAEVNPNKNICTVCNGDTSNNIWFVPRAPGFPGRCILDELTYGDVYFTLLRNPKAARDLARITDQPMLQSLAREVKLVQDPVEDDAAAAKRINANSIPFYTVLRGNSGGDIR